MTEAAPALVLFDLDGVLVDYDRETRIRHLGRAVGVAPDIVGRALFGSGLEDRFDAGAIDDGAYLAELGAALGVRVDRSTWAAARAAAMRMDPALPALLARVAHRCDIAVLTNNGGLLLDVLPDILPALAGAFGDRLLCSARLGARKPDATVYLEAVRRLAHRPAATLFLDDSVANVDGACRAGLLGRHVAGPAALAGVLASYGLG